MDYEDIAAALETRFTGITAPTGERAATATDDPPNSIGQTPLIVVDLPPLETLEWGPSKLRYSEQTWTVWLMLAQEGDFPRRKRRMAKWQKAILNQVVAQIQLGLSYVDMAEIRGIQPTQQDWAEIPYDALRITVNIQTREVVTGAAA